MKSRLVYVFAVIIFLSLFAGVAYLAIPAEGSDMPTTTVKEVFLDMNNDGLVDYVRWAEVVLQKPNPTQAP